MLFFNDEQLSSNDQEIKGSSESSVQEANDLQVSLLKDQLARVAADFENFKRRADRDKRYFYDAAKIEVVNSVLPVLDELVFALQSFKTISNVDQNLLNGVNLVLQNFEKNLKGLGVSAIEATTFDPELHEAIGQVEDATKSSGEIISVVKKGFMLGDKVLRHPQVLVAK